MTNTYRTLNPLGSTSPKDLYDNASNFDDAMNSLSPSFIDRFNRRRETWAGMEAAFGDFLINSGYQFIGDYDDPGELTFTQPNQIMSKGGEYWRPGPSLTLPYTTVNNWVTDQPKFVSVGDAALRTALAAATGSNLVGFSTRTVMDKLSDVWVVDDFRIVGEPTVNDATLFDRMASATGGVINLLEKRYVIDNWAPTLTYLRIVGAGKPSYDSGYTQLQNGTILQGHFEIRAEECHISNFGVDVGTANGYAHGQAGFTVDAPVGVRGRLFTSRDVTLLGSDTAAASTSHGFLVEGFDRNYVDGTDCANFWYGLILKGRQAFVSNTNAYHIGGTPVFIKSDLPASAGNVLDATVANVIVDGVISFARTGDLICNHVHVMASTAVLGAVQVNNVQGTFGRSAVTVAGGGALLYCAGVNLSNIKAVGCYMGVEVFGTTYDVTCNGLEAENPTSGLAFKTSGASSNWRFTNTSLLLSDVGIVSTYAATTDGTGNWDNFTCRSGNGTKRIPFNPASVACGQKHGDVIVEGEGTIPLGSNWSSAAPALSLAIGVGNLAKVNGKIQNVVATGNSLGAVPTGCRYPGDFLCAAYTSGGTATTAVIRWDAAGALTLITPAYTVLAGGSIDLSQMMMQY